MKSGCHCNPFIALGFKIYTTALVHPSCKTITKTSLFFRRRRFWCESNPGFFCWRKISHRKYCIQSQRLYCFRHQGCWNRRQFGPHFMSLLAILQCSKKQGPCLLQVSNTHTPCSSEFYGDVLHEGINSTLLLNTGKRKVVQVTSNKILQAHISYNSGIYICCIRYTARSFFYIGQVASDLGTRYAHLYI